ncbi:MAG: hypothetical protein HQK51_11860 [Oligoflexia bacterium]|nr:hypothetical protein [Oligoflexia bacterium]
MLIRKRFMNLLPLNLLIESDNEIIDGVPGIDFTTSDQYIYAIQWHRYKTT